MVTYYSTFCLATLFPFFKIRCRHKAEEVGHYFCEIKFKSRARHDSVQILLTQRVDMGCGGRMIYYSLWNACTGALM